MARQPETDCVTLSHGTYPCAEGNLVNLAVDPLLTGLPRFPLLSPPEESAPSYRVLIVDDDLLIRRILERWLSKAGYAVQESPDAYVALQIIQNDPPDIIIADWEMPGMSGPGLCEQLRRMVLPRYVYTLILTSRGDCSDLVTALNCGADDFLSKPIREPELLARLGAAVRILTVQRQLQEMAQRDALTGLFTQRSFYQLLCKEFEQSRRTGSPLSCAMVDLDFFKRINDVYGHPVGDLVLNTCAKVLRRSSRASDVVCRYGGEEFCVLLPDTSEDAAVFWAERFRNALNATRIEVRGQSIAVTCSIGVSQVYDDDLTAEQLVDQADQALLCAKRAGRDRVVRFSAISRAEQVDLADGRRRADLFEGVLARHVMTPIVAPLTADDTVAQVADYFLRSRISSAPVVDQQGQLIGIISETDLMAAMTAPESWNRPISELLRPHVITYPAETPLRVIYEFLCRVSMQRIIITENNVPVGAISRASLVRWFRNLVLAEQDRQSVEKREVIRDEIAEAAQRDAVTALLLESHRLHDTLERRPPDLADHLVGAASRIQELATDMLAYANVPRQETSPGGAGCGAGALLE